ncbi:MAG: hypothetical protein HY301_07475 [Verrucomicrobia bacterium]|nr:hypothetical protein [Verrucomicrobiota bacterium]
MNREPSPTPAKTPRQAVHKFAERRCRHASGTHYVLVKRGGKQFTKRLKTNDRKSPGIAAPIAAAKIGNKKGDRCRPVACPASNVDTIPA